MIVVAPPQMGLNHCRHHYRYSNHASRSSPVIRYPRDKLASHPQAIRNPAMGLERNLHAVLLKFCSGSVIWLSALRVLQ